jgi:hypothetical protein
LIDWRAQPETPNITAITPNTKEYITIL